MPDLAIRLKHDLYPRAHSRLIASAQLRHPAAGSHGHHQRSAGPFGDDQFQPAGLRQPAWQHTPVVGRTQRDFAACLRRAGVSPRARASSQRIPLRAAHRHFKPVRHDRRSAETGAGSRDGGSSQGSPRRTEARTLTAQAVPVPSGSVRLRVDRIAQPSCLVLWSCCGLWRTTGSRKRTASEKPSAAILANLLSSTSVTR